MSRPGKPARTLAPALLGLALGAGGCLVDGTDGGGDNGSSDDGRTPDGPASGGDLFINSCHKVGASSLVCEPFVMSIQPGDDPQTSTRRLPEVVQDNLGGAIPGLPGSVLHGSTTARAERQIFWHAGCDAGYHVTDIDTGETRRFELDLERLGIGDAGSGFCLQEWAYDDSRDAAIALGGVPQEGRSTVQFALTVDASGEAEVVQDLRGKLDSGALFLHPFETLAAFDPGSDELLAPIFLPPSEESVLVVDLTTGTVERPGAVGCWIHAFFDDQAGAPTFFDCHLPGWTTLAGTLEPRIPIDRAVLAAADIDQDKGYVGGGYDPVGRQDLFLMRTRAAITDPDQHFVLAVADLAADRFRGLVETDLRVGAAPGDGDTVYLMTEFVPPAPVAGP